MLPLNKGDGFDGIHTNYLKFRSDDSCTYLAIFFNMCSLHQHVPQEIKRGVIRPLNKNKFCDRHDLSIYHENII